MYLEVSEKFHTSWASKQADTENCNNNVRQLEYKKESKITVAKRQTKTGEKNPEKGTRGKSTDSTGLRTSGKTKCPLLDQ